MTDELPLLWEAQRHTLAKHKILEAYLQAWIPIMSYQSRRVPARTKRLLFVDGFAGPGVYKGGQPGSPVRAIKSALEHKLDFPVPMEFAFIEQDTQRCSKLRTQLDSYKPQIERSSRISGFKVIHGDCETELNSLIRDHDRSGEQFGPALVFLDQFGYSRVSMQLIARILSHRQCEVFSYLNWRRMNQFMTDQSKWDSITRAFGGQDWSPALKLAAAERCGFVLQTYKRALRAKARAQYIWHFAMFDSSDNLIYWLFFCTNNMRGLEEMKKAMSKVDRSGLFRFSDKKDPAQFRIFEEYTDEMLAEELQRSLGGQRLRVSEVREFVLTETPASRHKGALTLLERTEKLRVVDPPAGRRKGTFPNPDMVVEFLSQQ